MPSSEHPDDRTAKLLRPILKSQYHAGLAMLRKAIEVCPESLWVDTDYRNPFWRVAYHALFYTHLYLHPDEASFTAWERHQTSLQHLDDVPGPAEIEELLEPVHRIPQSGEPFTKADVLEYWSICDRMVDDAIDAMNLEAPDSGFSWYPVSKLEHQIVELRHLQHHTAQLVDRLRASEDAGVEWVGAHKASC